MSREDLWHNGPVVSPTVLQQSTKTLVTSVLNERTAASPTWESSITAVDAALHHDRVDQPQDLQGVQLV